MKSKFLMALVALYFFLSGALLCFWLLAKGWPVDVPSTQPPLNFPEESVTVLDDLIKVTNPTRSMLISSPVRVSGEARGNWYFEASFPVQLVDDNGFVLAERPLMTSADWMTSDYVPFSQDLFFAVPSTPTGRLILKKDNPSGLPEHEAQVEIPVRFSDYRTDNTTTMSVKVFMSDPSEVNEPNFNCQKTKAVERIVPKSIETGRAALEALLRGLTPEEITLGYTSSLPTGARLNSLKIIDKTALADFNDDLQYQAGGSCRVKFIRAQITDTLTQFSTINKVVISINGQVEDILQP